MECEDIEKIIFSVSLFFSGFFLREVVFFLRTSKMILSQTRTKTSLYVLHATLINFTLTFVMALTLGHRLASYQSKTETVSLTLEQHFDNKSCLSCLASCSPHRSFSSFLSQTCSRESMGLEILLFVPFLAHLKQE